MTSHAPFLQDAHESLDSKMRTIVGPLDGSRHGNDEKVPPPFIFAESLAKQISCGNDDGFRHYLRLASGRGSAPPTFGY